MNSAGEGKNDRLQQLLDFLKQEPGDPFLKYGIALEYLKLGKAQEAAKWLLQLIEENKRYLPSYYKLGQIYEGMGNKEEALKYYRLGVEIAKPSGNQHALGELRTAISILAEEEEE